jgi:hypothetical protein
MPQESLSKIVEIKALRLAVLVVCNYKIGNRLGFRRSGLGITRLLALRFTLQLFSPFLLARPFFLAFGKTCS